MRVLSTLVDLARIAFFAYAVYLTYALMTRIGGQPMSVINWPIGLMYGVVLAGFALMTWRAVQVGIVNLRRGESALENPELADHH
jgi:TRAP-type C4-dicarboxylate transport system permease small subunit